MSAPTVSARMVNFILVFMIMCVLVWPGSHKGSSLPPNVQHKQHSSFNTPMYKHETDLSSVSLETLRSMLSVLNRTVAAQPDKMQHEFAALINQLRPPIREHKEKIPQLSQPTQAQSQRVHQVQTQKPCKETIHGEIPPDQQNKQKRGYTAVINVFSRPWNVFRIIAECLKSEYCAAVRVLLRTPFDRADFHGEWKLGDIELLRPADADNLNSRFYPIENIPTEAVLSVDDDCIMKVPDIDKMYLLWEKYPDRIVGPNCRLAKRSREDYKYNGDKYEYVRSRPCCNPQLMLLTSFALLHRKYHQLYTDALPRHLWNFVSENINCEDIFMNALVINYTTKPPIPFLTGNPVDEIHSQPHAAAAGTFVSRKDNALSDRMEHYQQRSECVVAAVKAFKLAYSPAKPDNCK
eukprot:TRINITY_DN361_c0_g1_i1.p1 TRINITY_DN361_c0_g1~~TRINITY_DN361_c0_g1_i1.p1  ORF type:complete len:407 (+),score=6.87 TRINITY_DN361_c0_g1_i1:54-1274(+)